MSGIQDYVILLYETQEDTLLNHMQQIVETMLEHYPDHVESLSNLSVVHMIRGDFQKALDPLLKAEKIDKSDAIVLSNIANCYFELRDFKNARKYYSLTIANSQGEMKEFAVQRLKDLKKM